MKGGLLRKWGELFCRMSLDCAAMSGRVMRSANVQVATATH